MFITAAQYPIYYIAISILISEKVRAIISNRGLALIHGIGYWTWGGNLFKVSVFQAA